MMYCALPVDYHGIDLVDLRDKAIIREKALHQFDIRGAGVMIKAPDEQAMSHMVPSAP